MFVIEQIADECGVDDPQVVEIGNVGGFVLGIGEGHEVLSDLRKDTDEDQHADFPKCGMHIVKQRPRANDQHIHERQVQHHREWLILVAKRTDERVGEGRAHRAGDAETKIQRRHARVHAFDEHHTDKGEREEEPLSFGRALAEKEGRQDHSKNRMEILNGDRACQRHGLQGVKIENQGAGSRETSKNQHEAIVSPKRKTSAAHSPPRED